MFSLQDNYLRAAFKEKNFSFFTLDFLQLVENSSDGFVIFMVVFFCAALLCFALGLFSQIACIAMTLGCYYFYALNALHIGTLSYDILLVTLFLMCVTGYHGDSFSLDALRRADPDGYFKKRPFFIQRLLQLQIASTYFYTALCKFTAKGNWLTGNPMYCLFKSTPESVVKHFPLRELLAQSPELCYVIGLGVIAMELLLPVLLFWKRTRVLGIGVGIIFHILLVVTLHVPTIFFFLFVPQLFLFIDPEEITAWIEKQRQKSKETGRGKMLYDGHCHFCVMSIRRLGVLDIFRKVEPVDFQTLEDLSLMDWRLTREKCQSRIQFVTQKREILEGFEAFRYLSTKLPLLWPMAPIFYFPGMRVVGNAAYDFIAKNRYLLHWKPVCRENQCFHQSHKP